jgi:hypothetical protein
MPSPITSRASLPPALFQVAALGITVMFAAITSEATLGVEASDAATFDTFFEDKTMRVDYFHSGTATEEHLALDRAVSDGPWAGNRVHLVDSLNLGKFHFEVRDLDSNRLLFLQGFCSIFGEWETTGEAKTTWGTFHASLRFPWPRHPVQVVVKKRVGGLWREIWSTKIDPSSRFANSADRAPAGDVWPIFENGPVHQKVDLVILGDGFSAKERDQFHADAIRLVGRLFETEPFQSRKDDFNVRAVDLAAAKSGVTRPNAGESRRSPINVTYSIFGSERYALTLDNRALRDAAASAPYDCLIVLMNERKYGGGGIYNDQAVASAGNRFGDYIFVHEFGHHFAGLADEYYVSSVAYEQEDGPPAEPWEPNISATTGAEKLKWRDLLGKDTPVPTPWTKEEYEEMSRALAKKRNQLRETSAEENELETLFSQERKSLTKLLSENDHAGEVGAFEGAGYRAHGLYRPAIDCIMFTRNEVGFCPVCRRAIERVTRIA